MRETHNDNPKPALVGPRAAAYVRSRQPTPPMKALTTLFKTDNTISTLILRLTLGVVFFPHGAQKVLGWFGGYGFTGTMGFFTGTTHLPAPLGLLTHLACCLGAFGVNQSGRSNTGSATAGGRHRHKFFAHAQWSHGRDLAGRVVAGA